MTVIKYQIHFQIKNMRFKYLQSSIFRRRDRSSSYDRSKRRRSRWGFYCRVKVIVALWVVNIKVCAASTTAIYF